MPKSLTKLWLKGLKRLVATQIAPSRTPKPRTSTRPVIPKAAKSAASPKPAVRPRTPVKARAERESRVRPRASAWAAGKWTRSFHSAPPAAGRFVNHLAYALYLPANAAAAPMPLLVMMHGCQQSAEDLAQGTRVNLLADQYGFAVLYPEQSKTAHVHRCWHWYEESAVSGGGEAASVVSLVREIVAQHDVDSERIYLAGMSAGAGLAAMLAVKYPSVFAALGLHSGVVFGAAKSGIDAMDIMRRGSRKDPVALIDAATDVARYPGMPTVIVHGELDSVVSKVNAEQLTAEFLRLNRFTDATGAWRSGERREEMQPEGVFTDYVKNGRRVVRTCIVRGLGHAWSGGDDTVPFHSAKGPDASAMLWEFFKHQRRVQATVRDETLA
ncbi:MAG: PHB depolymerase family esterase [Pseudomonadota bacterium]|uniref:extracellular catalytic domain type 1 short-chain-length polyhydroxyalkanoate depolymerase n=1 Tax=Caballeronia sordidicola TaxID=196367 RepID=UPI000A37B68D|nr:PHB depolymerase family esterase [Caballeronia sordidicola]MDP9156916.1 PHB depolymerase family esterase [Pseudomonadota bacterium]